jgi:hypothetical protein
MFRHDVLRNWLILTVDDVHVELALAALDNGAQFGGILNAIVEGFKEKTANEINLLRSSEIASLCATRRWLRCCQTPFALCRLSSHRALEYHYWDF